MKNHSSGLSGLSWEQGYISYVVQLLTLGSIFLNLLDWLTLKLENSSWLGFCLYSVLCFLLHSLSLFNDSPPSYFVTQQASYHVWLLAMTEEWITTVIEIFLIFFCCWAIGLDHSITTPCCLFYSSCVEYCVSKWHPADLKLIACCTMKTYKRQKFCLMTLKSPCVAICWTTTILDSAA